jgi:peptidoglycan/LPS O-acetylase OafA/YrhL
MAINKFSNAEIVGFHLGHRPVLDGLRGVAVLLVTAYHLNVPFFQNGFLGVDIFFVLSGFLITSLLLEELCETKQIDLKKFYLRRFIRLYPALLLMLLIIGPISKAYTMVVACLTYSTNWIMAFHILPMSYEFSHTWSLAIEEQYYLFWPFIVLFLSKKPTPRRLILVPIIFGLLSALLRNLYYFDHSDFWRIYAGTDSHVDGLLLGSAIGAAIFFRITQLNGIEYRLVARIGLLVTVFVLMAFIFNPSIQFPKMIAVGPLVVSILSCVIIYILVFVQSTWLEKVLSNRILTFIGSISYGIYLWQMPIIQFIKLDTYHLSPIMVGVIQLAVIFMMTMISYKYIEQPVMRSRKLFIASHRQVS